ncbi:MAG: CoA-acylating methylmalonate-semialdehyde dehydrogenase [Propioniciclava sp.]
MSTASIPTIQQWIDGNPAGDTSQVVPIQDPATGVVIAQVMEAGPQEIDQAVASAAQAFDIWSDFSVSKRAQVMFRFRELIVRHTDDIAAAVTREHGKVLADAKGEVARGLEVVEFACGIPQLLKGEYSDQAASGIDVFSFRQPLGVVAGITPFNFPVMIPLWMSPVALATGNTFVLKPPTMDPSASMLLAEMWSEAGLPDGAFNVVHGNKEVVSALLTHPDVAAVSFVGSTPTAKIIHETATQHGKRVQALGGAKNHAIVLADADLSKAADNLIAAAFGAAGERCMALPVVLVEDAVADELVALVTERARTIKMRAGTDADADMGPVITAAARDRIVGLIDSAEREGGQVLVDGRGVAPQGLEDGYWVGPTVIDKVTPDMAINGQEVFGPVMEVVRIGSLAEGISLIQQHQYGNGSAIFTSSGAAARAFQRARGTAGMIGINVPIPVPVAWHSFGGWKDSLIGESHMYGPEGVQFFTRGRVVTQRWPDDQASSGVSFHFSGDAQK